MIGNLLPAGDGELRGRGLPCRLMRRYYEDLWERLPEELSPPELGRRLQWLLAEVAPGERVLDLGCGTGRFTAELARAGADPVGIEVAQAALGRALARHPGHDFRLAPIDGPLPLDDGSFELVWASEVIEHVADTATWLSEVRRVLVPRGRLLLSTPDHPRLALALRGIGPYSDPLGDHLHLYTRRSLAGLLAEFGFGEVRVTRVGGLPLWRRTLQARAAR